MDNCTFFKFSKLLILNFRKNTLLETKALQSWMKQIFKTGADVKLFFFY